METVRGDALERLCSFCEEMLGIDHPQTEKWAIVLPF